MAQLFVLAAALAGGLAVLMGAFAAHGLKEHLDAASLSTFQTGVEYQFYHALALLGVGILLQQWQSSALLNAAGLLFVFGILLFSGSLYGLALLGWKWLGPVTPLGGLCLLAGWVCMLAAALRYH